ncbi:MAG: putative dehydrogenase [Pseudarthrobacter sp.]|nr:putative dehydrogenase [Pseudarthrobacter sp.]
MGKPLKVGIVGCGAIIAQYLTSFRKLQDLELVAVADLDPTRAKAVAEQYEGVRAVSVEELLAADDVELVLNLTIPAAHAGVALKAIAAGKSVYGEKPLAATTAEARTVLEAAREAGVVVGCAPDTVLGTGIQTARKAIDDGLIGAPISASATMVTPGHERWHPNPDFYYQPGGGPLLDMGPYYVTALVTLLGPVVSVTGAASHTRNERTIASGPRQGEKVPVAIDSHVTGVLTHASGALSTLLMSFDAVKSKSPNIEIQGNADRWWCRTPTTSPARSSCSPWVLMPGRPSPCPPATLTRGAASASPTSPALRTVLNPARAAPLPSMSLRSWSQCSNQRTPGPGYASAARRSGPPASN